MKICHCPHCQHSFFITDIINQEVKKLSPDKIIDLVVDQTGISYEKMRGLNRGKQIVQARFFAMMLLRKYTTLSLNLIGQLFNRDHTTVIHGLRTLKDRIDTEGMTQADYGLMDRECDRYVGYFMLNREKNPDECDANVAQSGEELMAQKPHNSLNNNLLKAV